MIKIDIAEIKRCLGLIGKDPHLPSLVASLAVMTRVAWKQLKIALMIKYSLDLSH